MAGAPSQIDLFDPKPTLTKHDGQDIPDEFVKGERFAFIKGKPKLLASPFKFARTGNQGREISELLPNLAKVADDITIIRSMRTTQFNHAPAQIFMNTGHQVIGRPSLGSWLSYGLGSENSDLPASSCCSRARTTPTAASRAGAADFCPPSTRASSSARAASRCSSSRIRTASTPRCAIARLPRSTTSIASTASTCSDPEIQTRIAAYELAYRMQTSVPELTDLVEGAGVDPRALWHGAGQGVVRQQLPARAPARRARRALRPALSPRLGHARRVVRRGHRREAAASLPADRSAGLRRC